MSGRREVPDTPETLAAVARIEDESTQWRLAWSAKDGTEPPAIAQRLRAEYAVQGDDDPPTVSPFPHAE